jgi:hypothetical protein
VSSVSSGTLSPIQRMAALAGGFLALGVVVVAASQGGAAASAQDQQERAIKIESAHSVTQGVTYVESVQSKAAAFTKALGTGSLAAMAEPGNQLAAIDLATQTCDVLPTWAASKAGVADGVSEIVGSAIGEAQLTSFASAASAVYCPAQLANLAR